ncbi:HNH endonuclease [Pseudoflavonifractor sp. MSJ-37]|uniref:HNH endonuclease n=1 Tax=Pseudoflavonifractor sp. MSJ-37 TaxID=2841531 RepID=UPI001C0FC31B|nr:HNH endonuclease [Pseudoflavonifractor sp. MSJ-37]MBU5434473.1 HNH endonuclease [Pseudoflavonifractor sp. MSJ-37]
MPNDRYGQKWSEEETILAFYRYCQVPLSKATSDHPDIIRLAELLGRTTGSVRLKFSNLAHFDPNAKSRNISGMSHGSRFDEIVTKQFWNDWEGLVFKAMEIEADLQGTTVEELVSDTRDMPVGATIDRTTRARVGQTFFREAVLSAYQQKCCITGLAVPSLLIASHIKPWSKSDPCTERTNPANGLCLNGLHDRAFDQGLITVLPDYTVRVSSRLHMQSTDDPGVAWLLACDRQEIRKPDRFLPKREFLEYHNEVIFRP